jgi:magnesium-transporting ATPase (P-type)
MWLGTTLAVIYTYTKDLIPTKHPILRGAMFGGSVWFLFRSFIILFNLKELILKDYTIVMFNIINSILYGIIIAFVLEKLEKKNN